MAAQHRASKFRRETLEIEKKKYRTRTNRLHHRFSEPFIAPSKGAITDEVFKLSGLRYSHSAAHISLFCQCKARITTPVKPDAKSRKKKLF